jgi:mxaC protein
MPFDFTEPWMLLLLPLSLLPLVRRRNDNLAFSALAWLPADPLGRALGALWRGCAVVAMAAIVVGLAAPARPETDEPRIGRGAEIMLLMDRSASMDARVPRRLEAAGIREDGSSKNELARVALSRFVTQRTTDRFGLMMFGTSPLLSLPLTRDHQAIEAAIAGTAIGRGMPDTVLDRALISAIDTFNGRPYAGSRVIVLVSDGGARLSPIDRRLIAAGLERNRIALYFIYLRSGGYSPNLNAIAPSSESSEEVELHRYFLSLKTPYHWYQAEDSNAMAAAMAQINREQNLPASFAEHLPRQDRSAVFFAAALAGCTLLLALRLLQLRSWS